MRDEDVFESTAAYRNAPRVVPRQQQNSFFFFPHLYMSSFQSVFFFPKTDWKLTGCVTREFLRVLEFYGWSPLALHSRHLLDCPLAPVHSGIASPRVKGLAHAANQPELRCMVKITIGA